MSIYINYTASTINEKRPIYFSRSFLTLATRVVLQCIYQFYLLIQVQRLEIIYLSLMMVSVFMAPLNYYSILLDSGLEDKLKVQESEDTRIKKSFVETLSLTLCA